MDQPRNRADALRWLSSAPAPDVAAETRARLKARFVIQEPLGQGGSGIVFRAYDLVRESTIAVKFLTAVDPGSLFRFKSEFRALANLTHPNLLPLHELLAFGEHWLLTMDLVEGPDFLSYVRGAYAADLEDLPDDPTSIVAPPRRGEPTKREPDVEPQRASLSPWSQGPHAPPPFDEARLRDGLLQLAEGLHALHRAERLHRDLKPANVLVSRGDRRVVICDFGLVVEGSARPDVIPTAGPRSYAGTFTSTRELAGTLAFMSPEQAFGEPLGPPSDWYAVGVMLYCALTGHYPVSTTGSYDRVIEAKRRGRHVHPREVYPQLPGDLAELAQALLQPDPRVRAGYDALRTVLAGSAARVPPTPAHPFLGRTAQLATLTCAYEQSLRGEAALVLVSGASGMGKSAMVQRFLRDVERAHDAVVLRARCYEREQLPYKTLDPLLDALSSHLLALEPGRAERLVPPSVGYLAALFPALRRVPAIACLPDPGSALADPRERRRLAFRALRELCTSLSRERPLVLFIDDLQWGDLDSLPLLQELLRPPSAPPLMMVCAYRSEHAQAGFLRATLQAAREREEGLAPIEIEVGALADEEARALSSALLPLGPRRAEAAARIAREAEGSPFFVCALSAHVAEHGLDEGCRSGLGALLAAQVDALSPPARSLLELLAVAGRPLALRHARAASALGSSAADARRELEARRLVLTSRSAGEERVECVHDRIREAVCSLLAPARLAVLHRALAEAIEESDAEDECEALLEHWRGAGEREKAHRYAVRGADKAGAALAFARAASLYREAIALLADGDPRARPLRRKLAEALMLAGRGPEAVAELQLLLPGACTDEALELRMLVTTELLRAGQFEAGYAGLARAADLFGVRFPRTVTGALAALLGKRALIRLRQQRFTMRAADALEDGTERLRLDALWQVAAAVSNSDLLRGNVYGAELMLRALERGDPSHVAAASGLEAVNAAAANDAPRMERMLGLAEEGGARSGQLWLIGRVRGMHAICLQLVGRFREAAELARQSQDYQRRCARMTWDHAIMIWWELSCTALMGELSDLALRVREGLRDAEARGDVYAATEFRTHRMSWAWLARDQPDVADAEVDWAERAWTPDGYQFQHWHMTFARGEIDLYRGTPARTLAALDREWSRALFVRQVKGVLADMLFLRARLALSVAASAADPALCRRALADARALVELAMPFSRALGALVLACAATFGPRQRACTLLEEAIVQLRAADMAVLAEAADARLGALAEGQTARTERALARLSAFGAKRPERFVQLLAPVARAAQEPTRTARPRHSTEP